MNFAQNLIIAEIGSVHDGSFGNALRLIEAAAASGAHVVKFQTHVAEAETLIDAPAPAYFKAEPRLAYFKRTSFSVEQWKSLAAKSKECGVLFLSSPFALEAVDILEEVNVSAYKIPSGEITNLPLLRKVAQTNKPVLLSSGMSTWKELELAVNEFRGNKSICVMQCTSAYPCPPDKVGLNNLAEIARRFPGVTVGYSDHTLGTAAGIAAATLGATVIEKHFTFSKMMYGSDAKHSMEPSQFKDFCESVTEAWIMRSSPTDKDQLTQNEMGDMKNTFQKSIVLSLPLNEGHILTEKDLAFKKPGDGISSALWLEVVGRKLKRSIAADKKITWDDLV